MQLFHHTNTDRFLSRLPVTPKASLVIIRNWEKQHIQPERSKKTGEKLILIIRKGDSVDTNHIPKVLFTVGCFRSLKACQISKEDNNFFSIQSSYVPSWLYPLIQFSTKSNLVRWSL